MVSRSPTLADIVATLDVAPVDADGDTFVAAQLDNPAHHIVGGHIAGQALMAAGKTADGRLPHSAHTYFLRAGDARRPVDFEVVRRRDGGALSTRQVTARQDGQVLLEALVSLSEPVDGVEYQQPLPDVTDPDSLVPVQDQLAAYADELGGYWVRQQPFDLRYVEAPPRLAVELDAVAPRLRMWWRPSAAVPADPLLHCALLTYLSGTTTLEAALVMRRMTPVSGFNALIDHALWFHRPADLSDWILSDQVSPSGIAGRGLASGVMYNRAGQLVCTASQELYFGRGG